MADRFIGWQPDFAATRRGLDIQDRGLDLRERELTRGGEDKRAALEKALDDQAWDRLFKEKELAQRGSLAREVERGRGERAEASEKRYYSSVQKKEFLDMWNQMPPQDKQQILDTPGMRENLEGVAGFPLSAGRYEKEKPLSAKEFETRRDILEGSKNRYIKWDKL